MPDLSFKFRMTSGQEFVFIEQNCKMKLEEARQAVIDMIGSSGSMGFSTGIVNGRNVEIASVSYHPRTGVATRYNAQ